MFDPPALISDRAVPIVALIASTSPSSATSTAIVTAMPSAVSTERRLERSTLRNGIRTMLLPKSGRCRRRCRRRRVFGAIAVLRIASTGGTRTARATGHEIATSDDEHAERRALRERSRLEPGLPHGKRKVAAEHVAHEVVDEQADADAEDHATERRPRGPTSSGRSAMRSGGVPSAIAMPISRRWASTIRTMRLNAPNAAPTRSMAAKIV